MKDTGWIKLYRSIEDWSWYKDNDTKSVFIHLLINARHTAGECYGNMLQPGQLITGQKALSKALGMTEQRVKTALKRLIKDGTISKKSTNKYSIVTLCQWGVHQNTQEQLTSNQPTTNQQLTSNQPQTRMEEGNNVNNEKNLSLMQLEKELLEDTFWKEQTVMDKRTSTALSMVNIDRAIRAFIINQNSRGETQMALKVGKKKFNSYLDYKGIELLSQTTITRRRKQL